MKIKIESYPCTFEFKTPARFRKFNSHCDARDAILHKAMKALKIVSPCHDYEDYTVEMVEKTKDGEIWHLAS